jgi:hypothetical protein
MGISQFPYMKLDAGLLLEANYFNIDSGSYEPLIEPWTFNAAVLQKTAFSAQEVKLSSDEMLEINMTYGMALAVKRITQKISQDTNQWEDEKKNEENKSKTMRTMSKKKSASKKYSQENSARKTRQGEDDDEVSGFYFENYLGLSMRITLENFDGWKEQGIELSEDMTEASVITFQDWEEAGERNFRNLKELHNINKHVKKVQNDGKYVENFEDNIIRYDLFIDGFEPVTGVPIEIAGRRSYELSFKGMTDKQKKKEKYEYSITVNVRTEGHKKVVSFESQLSVHNKTEFDIEIAQVMSTTLRKDVTELTKDEILKALESTKEENKNEGSKINKYDDIESFEAIFANNNFKVPLKWFLDEVSIFYKCDRGDKTIYRRLIPNLKKLFLKKNKDDEDKPESHLSSYHLLRQENIDNTFIALDLVTNKCRPTALDRPPHYECNLVPPICLNNMTFSDISVIRETDDAIMHTIRPGSYGYLYTGVETRKSGDIDSDSEDEKVQELKESKKKDPHVGEVKYNKYTMKFVDDGNVMYVSEADYFYSYKHDYKFYPEDIDDNQSQKDDTVPVTLSLDVTKYNTFIYAPYVLINKTNIPIYFGEKGKKPSECKLIHPHSNEFFNPTSKKNKKYSICVDNYGWAQPFDITTMGMSGEATMKRNKEFDNESDIVQRFNSNNLNMGVLISQLSSPYGKTTSIKFVPRYVFVNCCTKPLVLAQDNDKTLKQYFVKPNEQFTYNFENKDEKGKNNFVKIREPTKYDSEDDKFVGYHEVEPTDWSSRFSIDDFEDFQVSIKSSETHGPVEEVKDPIEEKQEEEDDEFKDCDQEEKDSKKDELKWYEPSELNEGRRFIRVIITTQDEATLFIMLCDPNMPEYRINNYTSRTVRVYQKDIAHRAIMRSCKRAKIIKNKMERDKIETYPIPFVWDDQTKDDKKVIIEIDGQSKEYDLDEIQDKKDFVIKKKKYYVKLISTGYFRELEIRDKLSNVGKTGNPSDMLKSLMLVSKRNRTGMKANLDLRGVGLSFVDKEPKEILYISIFKIVAKYDSETINKGRGQLEINEEYDLMVYHMQIDNMVSLENPILFSPMEILDKDQIVTNPEYTPFVQIKVSYSNNQSSKVSRKKIDAFQVMIQKMKVEVETGTLNTIIGTVTEITGVFGDQSTEYLSAQTVKERKERDTNSNTMRHTITSGPADVKTITDDKEEMVDFKKEHVCIELDTSAPLPPELSAINTDKLYFNMIHLGAIKINVSLRFEKQMLNFDINKGFGALTILYTIATSVATVSDAPLSFKELVITNIFQSQNALISNLTGNYVRQGMMQFYKLIGSSDLLGNPVGFVDKLGSGVFEFFNEPRKGMIKGPKEFVGGVGKGVTSLVTGVVSASFDSVSKISGSLYSVAKNVTGQEAMLQKKSENALEGVYDGVLGGGKEILGGVTGIFTKPFQGAKKDGAKGFVKGVGKGVLGLVASPFTAVLRAGHSVTQGVTNTAIRIKRGKLPQYGRFRHPRYINTRNILEPYDEDFAEVNQILIKIDNGKYSKHNIRYFADFPLYKDTKKTKDDATLIITEQTLLFCKDEKKMLYNTQLQDITDIAVYEGGNDSESQQKLYHLYVYSRKNKNFVFETVQYSLVDKTYSIVSKEKRTTTNKKRVTAKEERGRKKV